MPTPRPCMPDLSSDPPQVLLSQQHRLKALVLLGRFIDKGPWAVELALSVGIFPYVLKLLQTDSVDLHEILVFIWAKILALDTGCQADLVKVRRGTGCGHMHRGRFLRCLACERGNLCIAATPLLSPRTLAGLNERACEGVAALSPAASLCDPLSPMLAGQRAPVLHPVSGLPRARHQRQCPCHGCVCPGGHLREPPQGPGARGGVQPAASVHLAVRGGVAGGRGGSEGSGRAACHGVMTPLYQALRSEVITPTCRLPSPQAAALGSPLLLKWICLCMGTLWDGMRELSAIAITQGAVGMLLGMLQASAPEVRACAVFALGTLIRTGHQEGSGHGGAGPAAPSR